MAIASHLHHLFNPETCQAYIHALRWKERPLQCPRCQSHHVGPWGTYHYQPGLRGYPEIGLGKTLDFLDTMVRTKSGGDSTVRPEFVITGMIFRDCSESTGLPPEDVYRTVRVRTFAPGGQHDVRSR